MIPPFAQMETAHKQCASVVGNPLLAQSVYDCSRSYAALKIIGDPDWRVLQELKVLMFRMSAAFWRVTVTGEHGLVTLRLSVSEMETRLA